MDERGTTNFFTKRCNGKSWSVGLVLRILGICLVAGIFLHFRLFVYGTTMSLHPNPSPRFQQDNVTEQDGGNLKLGTTSKSGSKNESLQKKLQESESNWMKANAARAEAEKGLRGVAELEAIANRSNMTRFWTFFMPSFECPYKKETLGSEDGSKTVCGLSEVVKEYESNCVVYSFGINVMTSFDEAILEKTNCSLRMYDPDEDAPAPKDLLVRYPNRATFAKEAIGAVDNGVTRTLKTLMEFNKDTFISILKIDIEAGEWWTLERALLDFPDVLPFGQLLVEVHPHNYYPKDWYILTRNMWFLLERAGLRPFFREVNPGYPMYAEFGFINIRSRPFQLLPASPPKPLVWTWDNEYRKNISDIKQIVSNSRTILPMPLLLYIISFVVKLLLNNHCNV